MAPPRLPPRPRPLAPSSGTLSDSVFVCVLLWPSTSASLPPDSNRSLMRIAAPASLRPRCCAPRRVEPIPAAVANRAVALRQRLPVGPRDPVQVVHDPAVLHRQLAHQPLGRIHARA